MKNRVSRVVRARKIENVLVSVSDKAGLELLILPLIEFNRGVNFFSTGGTYEALSEIVDRADGGNVIPISRYTGDPELQGGLVKTLSYKIFLGLLSETDNASHRGSLQTAEAILFDMVVVNLYPFEERLRESESDLESLRGEIDIGGVALLRAAAKNFLRITTIPSPEHYPDVVEELSRLGGATSITLRWRLAQKTFATTASYDAAIAGYLNSQGEETLDRVYTILEEPQTDEQQ